MAILLREALPEFAVELERLLTARGGAALASQIRAVSIVERCRCHDDFCASFYTQPKPIGAYPPSHFSLDLDAERGIVLVDVVDGTMMHVEVLNRDDVGRKLDEVLPR